MGFLDRLILRTTKGVEINIAEYDQNPEQIAEQFDKFLLLDTTADPTGPNTPVGKLGNVIFSSTAMYRHDGTEWKTISVKDLDDTFSFTNIVLSNSITGGNPSDTPYITFKTENQTGKGI